MQYTISELKKELTTLLKKVKFASEMNGEIVLRMNAGNVCGIERKEIFK